VTSPILKQIAELPTLPYEQLKTLWREYFGAEPPAVKGVVVSTDTDNTGEVAEAYYGDVAFRARPLP